MDGLPVAMVLGPPKNAHSKRRRKIMKKNHLFGIVFAVSAFCSCMVSTACSQCKQIQEQGQQCTYRISYNATFRILLVDTTRYLCGKTDSTFKCKLKAVFILTKNNSIVCNTPAPDILTLDSLTTTGFEIRRGGSGLYTGSYDLYDKKMRKIGSGSIYILSNIGTHRAPVVTDKLLSEPCNKSNHSEGFLCGEVTHAVKTYSFYCQIALSNWHPWMTGAAQLATLEGILVDAK
jgi:hypothetical protein